MVVIAAGRKVSRVMDYLYSLYDALISINVPSDKARAVVDAMERDMGTTLATKTDLLLLRQEIENRFDFTSRDIESLRKDLESFRSSTTKDFEAFRLSIGKDLESLRLSMTVRLGSMIVVGFGLMLAALRAWT